MSCDVGKATEGLENELWGRWSDKGWRMSRAHSYSHSRAHSPIFPSLHLRHSAVSNPSFASPRHRLFTWLAAHDKFPNVCLTIEWKLRESSQLEIPPNPSIASPMSQLIFQPFFRFSYVTGFSLTSPGEPPMFCMLLKAHLVIGSLLHISYMRLWKSPFWILLSFSAWTHYGLGLDFLAFKWWMVQTEANTIYINCITASWLK